MDISVIVPLYNEEESLPELHAWIKRVMSSPWMPTSKTVRTRYQSFTA